MDPGSAGSLAEAKSGPPVVRPSPSASAPAVSGARGIGLQVILAVAAASTLIFGLSSYFILKGERQALIAEVARHAHGMSETIKSSTRYDMFLNHHEHLHQVVENVAQQEDIDVVRIFNKQGEVVYAPSEALEGVRVDQQAEVCHICHAADPPLEQLSQAQRTRIFDHADGGRRLGVINPIHSDASCWQAACHAHAEGESVLGVLEVTMPLDEVDRQLSRSGQRTATLSGAAILTIVLILWLFFKQRVTRPVEPLLEATNRVAAGDLEHQLLARRNDELGLLQSSFNEMTRRLATARSQVYQADKLASIGRLAAGVAHEINNPLTGVLVHSSSLRRLAAANTAERRGLEIIVREAGRCREIVKGLLDFARQAPLSKVSVDINSVVERAVRIVDNELSVRGIEVIRELRDDLPAVSVDVNQLIQVLINLLVNAAAAIGPEGGTVRVATELRDTEGGQMVEITVADDGSGIPEEYLGRIFEPFFTTKEASGTGLGLAVVWGIVEEHGGTIRVESHPGVGATFTILLPLGATAGTVSGLDEVNYA